MNFSVIIPARYKSSRFPGKPLAKILDKPLIIRVIQNIEPVINKNKIFVATDDIRISNLVKDYGYKTIQTSDGCETGTDRVAEASKCIKDEIIINLQGDEPLIDPEDIIRCYDSKKKHKDYVVNSYIKISSNEKVSDLSIPKVIFNKNEELVYMSRSIIPGKKDINSEDPIYYKQVCIYGFNKKQLNTFASYGKKSNLEKFEDIEILRFLDLNIPIKLFKASKSSIAVDNPEDIIKVENFLIKNK